jgi:hypothetical protein
MTRNALQQLNSYLNNIRDMKGEFTQTSPRGQVANGVFYISKPGKMRFEYAPPSPLLVVSDGSWVTVKNTKRNRDDQYPLSTTPLKLVLSDQVNLFEQAIILNVEHRDNLSAITMQEKGQLVAGQLTMVFDRKQQRAGAMDHCRWQGPAHQRSAFEHRQYRKSESQPVRGKAVEGTQVGLRPVTGRPAAQCQPCASRPGT